MLRFQWFFAGMNINNNFPYQEAAEKQGRIFE